MSESENTKDYTLDALAAGALGDLWLSADAVALVLGMMTPKGLPNRRGFLEHVACRPGFPRPVQIGNQKKWRKSAVMEWAEEEARVSRAA